MLLNQLLSIEILRQIFEQSWVMDFHFYRQAQEEKLP